MRFRVALYKRLPIFIDELSREAIQEGLESAELQAGGQNDIGGVMWEKK